MCPDIWVAILMVWHFTTWLSYCLCPCLDVLGMSEISRVIWKSKTKPGTWKRAFSLTVLVSQLAFPHQESPVPSYSSLYRKMPRYSIMAMACPCQGTRALSLWSLGETWEALSWKHSTCCAWASPCCARYCRNITANPSTASRQRKQGFHGGPTLSFGLFANYRLVSEEEGLCGGGQLPDCWASLHKGLSWVPS